MKLKKARATVYFESGDLKNKTWEQVLAEIAEDTKKRILKDLKEKYRVPDNMTVDVILNFIDKQ